MRQYIILGFFYLIALASFFLFVFQDGQSLIENVLNIDTEDVMEEYDVSPEEVEENEGGTETSNGNEDVNQDILWGSRFGK
ncbi:hypothetical protein [Bacillus solitudinis]|uniref:hypothetical protein n=1 Tax=Bacillus solitudinis TaxID=2014074 RepID=UPI0012FD342C|nr:hypothetical protein [Bacillus solitudinis]